jgi:periplasmic protein TonB
MSNATMYDELDRAVNAFIADPESRVGDVAGYLSTQEDATELCELLEIAAQLEHVARPAFKAQLKADLLDEILVAGASGDVTSYVSTPHSGLNQHQDNGHRHNGTVAHGIAARQEQILPSLFGNAAMYSAQCKNFAASVLLHATAMGVLIASSTWMAQRAESPKPRIIAVLTDVGVYVPKPARDQAQTGGGASGDRSKLSASHGQPPKFAYEQFAPPTVIVHNPEPVLTAPPTVLGPPNLSLPQLSKLGDPLSHVVPASNGTGSGGGIGANLGTGVGSGDGSGVGMGSKGGIGGSVFRIGGGVSAPRPIYAPDPEYSEEARKAKYQGKVVLWAIIDADGLPKDIRVQQPLGMGLDQKAVAAVRQWRFDPARKSGQPVAVQVNIEMTFRLY